MARCSCTMVPCASQSPAGTPPTDPSCRSASAARAVSKSSSTLPGARTSTLAVAVLFISLLTCLARIKWTNGNKCVDLTGGSLAVGNQVGIFDCYDIPNQTWGTGYMCVSALLPLSTILSNVHVLPGTTPSPKPPKSTKPVPTTAAPPPHSHPLARHYISTTRTTSACGRHRTPMALSARRSARRSLGV